MNHAMASFQGIFSGAIAALVATLVWGCSAPSTAETPYTEAPPTAAAPTTAATAAEQTEQQASKGSPLLGVWEGTIFVRRSSERGRAGGRQIVTITLVEGRDSKVTGYYKCSYGNQDCLGQNTTGNVVTASLDGSNLLIRIRLPDATSSLYRGHVINSSAIGNYFVYAGGGVLEYGDWQARHSY